MKTTHKILGIILCMIFIPIISIAEESPNGDPQDLIDSFIKTGQDVVNTVPKPVKNAVQETVTKYTAPTKPVTTEVPKNVKPVEDVIEDIPEPIVTKTRNLNDINLGCTDENSRECTLIAYNLQQQFKGLYNIKIVPGMSSVTDLAGVRDGYLDWAIVNLDALSYHKNVHIEILTKLPPKYAHLILRKMNNGNIDDIGDLDYNDMIDIGAENSDSWTTWTILQKSKKEYLEIPTITLGGFRALAYTQMGMTQGFFDVGETQNKLALQANTDETLKLIDINDSNIYSIVIRGYKPYSKAYFGKDMYDELITGGWNPTTEVIEVAVVLISSKEWFDKHAHQFADIYLRIERAKANAKSGIQAN